MDSFARLWRFTEVFRVFAIKTFAQQWMRDIGSICATMDDSVPMKLTPFAGRIFFTSLPYVQKSSVLLKFDRTLNLSNEPSRTSPHLLTAAEAIRFEFISKMSKNFRRCQKEMSGNPGEPGRNGQKVDAEKVTPSKKRNTNQSNKTLNRS
jgi:hypothetical protein